MHRAITLLLTLLLLLAGRAAAADVTLFAGKTATPSSRTARGIAVDVRLLVVGFEFEFSDTAEDASAEAPALRSGMFNAFVQTPAVLGLRFYATAGGGLYEERLGAASYRKRGFGTNGGAGVKIPVAGPVGLRVDYRVFALRGSTLGAAVQRFYMGASLGF